MRVGIISDTHDQWQRTEFSVHRLKSEGVEAIFHCGDLVDPELINCFQGLPFYLVFGNNDDWGIPEIRRKLSAMTDAVCLEWGDVVELAGRRIAMTHGHLTTDIKRLLDARPDYLFSGHSHIAHDMKVGPTRRINPGALHRARSFSVATLDLGTDELRFIEIPRDALLGE